MKYSLALLFMSISLFGESQSKFDLGVSAGINFSSLHFSVNMDSPYKTGTGLLSGVASTIHFGRISVKSELQYATQVFEMKFEDESRNQRLKYYCINIPVIARFHWKSGFNLQSGISSSLLVSSSPNISGTINPPNFDLGFVFGIGWDFTNKMDTSIRYIWGVVDRSLTESGYSITGRMLQMTIGYRLASFGKSR